MILKLPHGLTVPYSAIIYLSTDDGTEPDGDDGPPFVLVRWSAAKITAMQHYACIAARKGQTEHELLAEIEDAICAGRPFDARTGRT